MRSASILICLLAFWALGLAPTTCVGGLLVHACEDDAGPACHHEESCPADPCNGTSFVPSATDRGRTDDEADLPAAPPVTAAPEASVSAVAPASSTDGVRPLSVVPLRC